LGLASNLTYGSLISARCLGSGWRIGVEFEAVTIDQEYRAVTSYVVVLDHGHVAIVQPIPVEPCRGNGVIFFPAVVSQDHNARSSGETRASWRATNFAIA
jgi:hypothetical protein